MRMLFVNLPVPVEIIHLIFEVTASSSNSAFCVQGLLSLAATSRACYDVYKASESTILSTTLSSLTAPSKTQAKSGVLAHKEADVEALDAMSAEEEVLFLTKRAIKTHLEIVEFALFAYKFVGFNRRELPEGLEHNPPPDSPVVLPWIYAVYHLAICCAGCPCEDNPDGSSLDVENGKLFSHMDTIYMYMLEEDKKRNGGEWLMKPGTKINHYVRNELDGDWRFFGRWMGYWQQGLKERQRGDDLRLYWDQDKARRKRVLRELLHELESK